MARITAAARQLATRRVRDYYDNKISSLTREEKDALDAAGTFIVGTIVLSQRNGHLVRELESALETHGFAIVDEDKYSPSVIHKESKERWMLLKQQLDDKTRQVADVIADLEKQKQDALDQVTFLGSEEVYELLQSLTSD